MDTNLCDNSLLKNLKPWKTSTNANLYISGTEMKGFLRSLWSLIKKKTKKFTPLNDFQMFKKEKEEA